MFQSDDFVCPEPEDRAEMQKKWSCDDFEDYYSLRKSYLINAFVMKGFQILVFSLLIIVIIFRAIKR